MSHPIRSLAQAYVYRNQCTPFGVYDGDIMKGYLMVIFDDEEQTYNLWHVMTDRRYQAQGIGRKATELALDYIRTLPFGAAKTVLLTVSPENTIAYRLYEKLGFALTGRGGDEEVEMSLSV